MAVKIEKPHVYTERIDICRNCHGTGHAKKYDGKLSLNVCDVCNGKGRVKVKKKIITVIETI